MGALHPSGGAHPFSVSPPGTSIFRGRGRHRAASAKKTQTESFPHSRTRQHAFAVWGVLSVPHRLGPRRQLCGLEPHQGRVQLYRPRKLHRADGRPSVSAVGGHHHGVHGGVHALHQRPGAASCRAGLRHPADAEFLQDLYLSALHHRHHVGGRCVALDLSCPGRSAEQHPVLFGNAERGLAGHLLHRYAQPHAHDHLARRGLFADPVHCRHFGHFAGAV